MTTQNQDSIDPFWKSKLRTEPGPGDEPGPDDDELLSQSLSDEQPVEFTPTTVVERMESQVIPIEDDLKGWVSRSLKRSSKYKNHFDVAEDRYGLPPGMLISVAAIESGGDPKVGSHAGARGLMQFIEPTAKEYGLHVEGPVDERLDPVKSIDAAGRLLRDSIKRSEGDIYQALIMYNWGSGNWAKWKSGEKQMMPDETRRYLGRFREAMKQASGMSDTSVAR